MPNADIPPMTPSSSPTPPVQTILASAARWGLTLLAGYLVERGITDQAHTSEFVSVGTGLVMGLISLCWSLLQKWMAHKDLLTALELPPGSTPSDVKAQRS